MTFPTPLARILVIAGIACAVGTLLLNAWSMSLDLSPLGWAGKAVMWGFTAFVTFIALAIVAQLLQK